MSDLSGVLAQNLTGRQCSEVEKYRAVYMATLCPFSIEAVAQVFMVTPRSVKGWIKQFYETGNLGRKQCENVKRSYTEEQKSWCIEYLTNNPLTYIHELTRLFRAKFGSHMHEVTMFRLIKNAGFSNRAVKRIAIQIQLKDVNRFAREMSDLFQRGCMQDSLLFLDEVSTDNRDMHRSRGWFLRGAYPFVTDWYGRSSRISLLAFLGVDGFADVFHTQDTYTRELYFGYVQQFIKSGKCSVFPGKQSVWILDGARIHMDANITEYIRSTGCEVVYLPAYCPFFNPIEYAFGFLKREFKRVYDGHGT